MLIKKKKKYTVLVTRLLLRKTFEGAPKETSSQPALAEGQIFDVFATTAEKLILNQEYYHCNVCVHLQCPYSVTITQPASSSGVNGNGAIQSVWATEL